MMIRKALLSLFLLFFIINCPQITYAADPNLEVKIDPDPVTSITPHIKVTVKTKDGSDYFKEPYYVFVAQPGIPFNKAHPCMATSFTRYIPANAILTVTPNQITADWDGRAGTCRFVPGEIWHFKLWVGNNRDEFESMDTTTIVNHDFTIAQSSGQIVTMTAKNLEVYAGERPTVILSNAIPNDKYSFYWDGVQDPKITRKFPDTGDNPANLEVTIPNFPMGQQSAALCLLYGWPFGDIIPPFKDCYSKVIFTFKVAERRPAPPAPGPGPINAKCTILPSNSLPINSAVNLKIENLPTGTKAAAYTLDSKGKQSGTVTGIADNTYTVTLSLLNKADPGSYNTAIYNEADGQKLCPDAAFNVSTTTQPPAAPLKSCGDSNVICSKAEVKPCPDPANPNDLGFQTAIGCLRTNPSSFAQDVLTFIVALGGGLAFLMMLLGAFQMLTSAGNPDTLNAGRERLTSAIIGLLFVIFSVLLMQIIGVNLLGLPGFRQ